MLGIVKYNVMLEAENSVHEAFRKLRHVTLEDSTTNALKQYRCLLFQPRTSNDNLTVLRWRMFHRKQAESIKKLSNLQLKVLSFSVSKDFSIRASYGNLQMGLLPE